MRKVLAVIVSIGIVLLLGLNIIPKLMVENESKNAAEKVLDNIIEGNFEKAFEGVYYFDQASDLEPSISYDQAKKRWVERVNSLSEDGVYIVGYDELQVVLDDSYPRGTVNLVIKENGVEKVKEEVDLWFGKSKDGWKLGILNYYKNDEEENWEIALSGSLVE